MSLSVANSKKQTEYMLKINKVLLLNYFNNAIVIKIQRLAKTNTCYTQHTYREYISQTQHKTGNAVKLKDWSKFPMVSNHFVYFWKCITDGQPEGVSIVKKPKQIRIYKEKYMRFELFPSILIRSSDTYTRSIWGRRCILTRGFTC